MLLAKTFAQNVVALRVVKMILVLQVGVFALLVGLNLLDYNSNFMFVQHVLSMDTTFEGNALQWRALPQTAVHHLAYALIIMMELGTGLLCVYGCRLLWRLRHADYQSFFAGIMAASYGLVLGLLLWFGGFMIVGAEWFLMWQSQSWNGQEAAFRFLVSIITTLIFIHLPEPTARAD